jgi:hypothetical protein
MRALHEPARYGHLSNVLGPVAQVARTWTSMRLLVKAAVLAGQSWAIGRDAVQSERCRRCPPASIWMASGGPISPSRREHQDNGGAPQRNGVPSTRLLFFESLQ